MQNNLKSVTFFFEKFLKFFSAYFLALLCGTSAGKSQILYAELYSFLQGLTCGRYCCQETPVLFKVIFLHIFLQLHVSAFTAFLPAAGRYGTASHARLYQTFIFFAAFLPPCILCLRHFFASKYNMLNLLKKRIFFAGKYATKNGTAIWIICTKKRRANARR